MKTILTLITLSCCLIPQSFAGDCSEGKTPNYSWQYLNSRWGTYESGFDTQAECEFAKMKTNPRNRRGGKYRCERALLSCD